MKISEILNRIDQKYDTNFDLLNSNDFEISSIEIDSRKITKGSIFVALSGVNNDGHKYLDSAIKNGAKAIIIDKKFDFKNLDQNFITIYTSNNFKFLIELLKIFYFPLPKNIFAVTGTNGKTSTAEFLRQILDLIGIKSASIGTLGLICDHQINKNITIPNLTTLDIVTNYQILYFLKKSNIDDVVMEVSSIGLDQERIAGLNINNAIFTNFSQDHLDYHKNMNEYFKCKMLLFDKILTKNSLAIINSDIEEYSKIAKICLNNELNIVDYGKNAKDFKLINILQKDDGQKIIFEFNSKKFEFFIVSKVLFDVYNVISAIAAIIKRYKISFEKINDLLQKTNQLKSASGRMQKVATLKNNAQIFIDFAHTPDSIKQIIQQARNITKKRVIILFGCGGNRDAKKRSIMGKIACDLADFVIITDDNPRFEDPAKIRQDIIKSCKKDKFIEISGRKNAITQAINMLQVEDILILAGKGHEKYQILGENKIEFDEEKIIKQYIESTQL